MDPELVSASVCSALLLEIQAAQEQQTPEACMRHVVSHALQAALGEACHTGALNRKLQVMTTTAWASRALTKVHSLLRALIVRIKDLREKPRGSASTSEMQRHVELLNYLQEYLELARKMQVPQCNCKLLRPPLKTTWA